MATIQDVETQEQSVITGQQAETTAVNNLTAALTGATTNITTAIADFQAQLQALLSNQPTQADYQQAITLAQQMQSTVTSNTAAITSAANALTSLGSTGKSDDPGLPAPPPPTNS